MTFLIVPLFRFLFFLTEILSIENYGSTPELVKTAIMYLGSSTFVKCICTLVQKCTLPKACSLALQVACTVTCYNL